MKRYILTTLSIGLLGLMLRNHLPVLLSIVVGSGAMLHKRYLDMTLGTDFVLVLVMLHSASQGALIGAIVGIAGFCMGMVISMSISRAPVMTLYTSAFYLLVAVVYSLIPLESIYAHPLMHVTIVLIPYTLGIFFVLRFPPHFAIRYGATNYLTNVLFIALFGGLLKVIYT